MKHPWIILLILLSSLLTGQKEIGSFPIIDSDNIYLFSRPDSKSKKLEKTEYPSFIIVYDTLANDMIRVNYKGQIGWMYITNIKFSKIVSLEIAKKMIAQIKEPISKPIIQPSNPINDVPPEEIIEPKKKIESKNKPKTSSVKKDEAKPRTLKKVVQKTKDNPKKVIENDSGGSGLLTLLILLIIVLTGVLIKIVPNYLKIRKKYLPIIDLDEALEKSQKELKTYKKSSEQEMNNLKADYKIKKDIYSSLIAEVNKLSDNLEMVGYGLYEPIFDFDTSDMFKEKIKSIRSEQKDLIRNKKAVFCHTEWTVEGSKAKGRTMTNRSIRMTLRAFNGECDAIVAKVRWNNVDSCLNRIKRSKDALDKLNESNKITIGGDYNRLKRKELRAVHEYNEKKHKEKEERRAKLKEEREEQKVLLEAEKIKKEAENEKLLAEKALEKVRKELGFASGKELEGKNEQIALLEQQLKDAIEKGERAKSRAQFTKQGHVYIISNIGSFGEGIYKIGLTRRLEPLIRVRELGDASVPFLFDLHAMIFSEDAPALERNLHEIFNDRRLNLVNRRKEFFRVTLEEIEEEVYKIEPESEFIKTAESREFRETLSLLNAKKDELEKTELIEDKFPESL